LFGFGVVDGELALSDGEFTGAILVGAPINLQFAVDGEIIVNSSRLNRGPSLRSGWRG